MKVKKVGIIGSGMIGSSIATLTTGHGYKTVLFNIKMESCERGLKRFQNNFKELVDNGLMTEEQVEICQTYLKITDDYKDLADADIIFECVPEVIDLKYEIFEYIEENCPDYKVVCSTTSALSATDIAAGFKDKSKVVIAHPWNPPHLVPCIELVASEHVSQDCFNFVKAFLESIGREVAIVKKDVPGFIANRIQHAIYREAIHMVQAGISDPADIDLALKYSFMPRYTSIGVFEHMDNAGLDMIDSIHSYLFADLDTSQDVQPYIADRVANGDLGVKTGKGIYDWEEDRDPDEMRKRAAKPYFEFFNWDLPTEKNN